MFFIIFHLFIPSFVFISQLLISKCGNEGSQGLLHCFFSFFSISLFFKVVKKQRNNELPRDIAIQGITGVDWSKIQFSFPALTLKTELKTECFQCRRNFRPAEKIQFGI